MNTGAMYLTQTTNLQNKMYNGLAPAVKAKVSINKQNKIYGP